MTTAVKWDHEIKGWGAIILDDGKDDLAKRDELVTLLRGSEWFTSQPDGENSELAIAVMDLEDSPTAEDADQALWGIYNLADDQRVWLSPFEDES